MKKISYLAASLVAISMTVSCSHQTIAKGTKKGIPADMPGAVAQDVSNQDASFSTATNDQCLLLSRGQIQVIGVDKQFGVLVKYTLPSGLVGPAGGPLCPDGALLFMDESQVSDLPAPGYVAPTRATEEAAAVRRMTGN